MDAREAYIPEDVSSSVRSETDSPAVKVADGKEPVETPRSTTHDKTAYTSSRPTILDPVSIFSPPLGSGLSESLDRLTRPMTVQRGNIPSASVGRVNGAHMIEALSHQEDPEPLSAKSSSSQMSLIEELKLNHARYHALTIKSRHRAKFDMVVKRIRELSQKGKSALKLFEPLETPVVAMLEKEGIKYLPDKRNKKEAILTWIY